MVHVSKCYLESPVTPEFPERALTVFASLFSGGTTRALPSPSKAKATMNTLGITRYRKVLGVHLNVEEMLNKLEEELETKPTNEFIAATPNKRNT